MGISKMVKATLESGITPIELNFDEITFFEYEKNIIRSFLTINSLDVGVLTYKEYRFVARRTKQGAHMVRRHIEKLFRIYPKLLQDMPNIDCITIPVYARLLKGGELATILVETFALFPDVPANKICIELSADILFEDAEMAKAGMDEIRELGIRIAICEVGDEFCPVFRLSAFKFDYAFMDDYSVESLEGDDADRIAGSLINYLHFLNVRVVAPYVKSEKGVEAARRLGCDGYILSPDIGRETLTGGDE